MAETTEKASGDVPKTAEQLQKEVDALKGLLVKALVEIKQLKVRLDAYENPNDGYSNSWTMVTKIVFLVSKAGKPLRSTEIIELLKIRHPEIIKKQNSLAKYVSAFLNTAMKHRRLIPYKLKGVRGNFYCLPDWVDGNGKLLPVMRSSIY